MRFSIIGSGNMAWFLGGRLVAGGHECAGVYGRNRAAVEELAGTIGAQGYPIPDLMTDGEVDVCFIAVSDAAIAAIAGQISFTHTLLVHTAGAVPLDAVANAAAERAVLWPVYSIMRGSLPNGADIPCVWEASTEGAGAILKEISAAITQVLYEVKYEQRKWLHLGAVMSNNFMNHLMAICDQVCRENGLPFSVLTPIIHQTFERASLAAPQTLQTGPAIRHDEVTIAGQLDMLATHAEWQKVYKALTGSIQEMGRGTKKL